MARLGAAKRLPAIASPISPGIVSGLVMRQSSRKTIESGCGSLSFFNGTGILSSRFNVVDNAMRGVHCAFPSGVVCTGRWEQRLAKQKIPNVSSTVCYSEYLGHGLGVSVNPKP